MFGDGTLDCLEVDVIRCRSNALIHNSFPLPIASIIDLHDCADLYYIDAGEPLDDPFEALPGTEILALARDRTSHIRLWKIKRRSNQPICYRLQLQS